MSCGCMNENNKQFNENSREGGYRYHVQIGVFRNYNMAIQLQLQLFEVGWISDIERQGDFYTVYMGEYTEIDKAALLELYLRYHGFNTLVIAV